ncbi:MAG TPA: integrase core domain-containing protein [Herpetosiphonaceae bacterium]|nr:integrase core domain-containing protein [Herpetosiphonaceae bacterium]
MFANLVKRVKQAIHRSVQAVRFRIAASTKPNNSSVMCGGLGDLIRTKPQLIAENALLRQQLVVLNRSVKRPRLTGTERSLLVLLTSRVWAWKDALLIVKPDTLLRWHRQGFRLFWRRKSRARSRAPRIPAETIALIKEMGLANRLWGVKRIQGELLKLDIKVTKRTIQRYIRQVRPQRPHSQTWATFLRNHAQEIWACDFLQLHDAFFRPLFAFFITELGSRRIVHVAVTRSPTDAWVAQQLREATPFGEAPRYLIRDNDAKYGPHFEAVATGTRIDVLRTPIRAPRANAICERLLGSVRRECLDHILIVGEAHLRRVLSEYVGYFNRSRPHQGINQCIPEAADASGGSLGGTSNVVTFPVLGGLHHSYRRVA